MVVKRKREVPGIVKNHWIGVVGGLASLVVVLTAFIASVFWLDSRYQKTKDAELSEARMQLRDAEQDKAMAISNLWAQYGLTQLRNSFIEDQVFNLTQRKTQLQGKFPAADEAMLQRYIRQGDQTTARGSAIRSQIDELSKPGGMVAPIAPQFSPK